MVDSQKDFIYVLQLINNIYIGKICCKKCINQKYTNYKLLDFTEIDSNLEYDKILNEYIYYYAYNYGLKNIKLKRDVNYKYCKCYVCNNIKNTKSINILKNKRNGKILIKKIEEHDTKNNVVERINYKKQYGTKRSENPLMKLINGENKRDKKRNDKLRLYGLK